MHWGRSLCLSLEPALSDTITHSLVISERVAIIISNHNMPSSNILFCSYFGVANYDETYINEVITRKFRALMVEPFQGLKISKYVEYLMRLSSEYFSYVQAVCYLL